MFVSRKKLKALVDENIAVRRENAKLREEMQRLSDSNFDLRWDNKMLHLELEKREQKELGGYFYEGNKNG